MRGDVLRFLRHATREEGHRGSRHTALGGVNQSWRTTRETSWAYANSWDVMSDA